MEKTLEAWAIVAGDDFFSAHLTKNAAQVAQVDLEQTTMRQMMKSKVKRCTITY